jgi:murein DD-endopeptidase MepM/ murein hydrolase activator NlpD
MSAPRHMLPRVPNGLARRAIAFVTALTLALAIPCATPPAARADTLSDLKSQLAVLRRDVQKAADAWDAAHTRLENTQAKVKATDARLKVEAKNLAKAEDLLAARADAMYRGGGQSGMIDFVLGAATWEDFVTRLDYATLIASSDAELIRSVKDTRARLERNRRDYAKSLVVQSQQAAEAKKKTDAMDAAFASKKAQYDRILASIAAEMARRFPGGSSYPPGPNGMVFPVQGPCAYSNTWGAPRSGGRSHKGTDIMARTGTPVVAICGGTVRSKSSSLGGLTIYLQGDNGWVFYYAHLNDYVVRSGRVKPGQLIAHVGSTGNARGGSPHLHLQMGPGGNWVNPYPYLRGMQ